jgi:CubicO group peptidase (beta-lactamase class C family)
VLQLVQAGKVRLDAPLGTYLTDYPNQDIAHQVTIHHLLTHTGGTGDIFGPEFAAHREQLRSLQDYVALYGTRAPRFPPGSRWEYSNYGFVLLGRVIEQVSGQSYYDYVAEHVFLPAGMAHTDFAPRDGTGTDAEDRAIGYTHFPPEGGPGQPPSLEPYPNTSIGPHRGSSAGGAYSTVGDLLAFASALESHRLLDAKHTELMTTGTAPMPDGGKYAYGFSDATNDGVRCVGHSGGGPGVSTHLRICRAPGETSSHLVAVLTNLDPPAGKELMRAARARFAPSAPTAATAANASTKATAANASRPCQDISLDDFEDGDVSVSPSGLGSSRWHSYHDLSGSTLLPEGDLGATRSDDSKYAAHVSGTLARTRFTWAGVAVQPSDMTAPFDLSPWRAVCFRARGSGTMRFDVSDVNTAPEGGVCRRCYDVFGANVTLSEGWTEHCVRLDALAPMGWGVPPQSTLTPEKVFGLSWSMHTPGSAYDLWVDDVRLICRSAK